MPETAMEYRARRHAEAQARIAAEEQAINNGVWKGRVMTSADFQKPYVSEGLERAGCCDAPVLKKDGEVTRKYYIRHRDKMKTEPCQPATYCQHLWNQKQWQKHYKKDWQKVTNPASCCGAPTDPAEYFPSSKYKGRHNKGTKGYDDGRQYVKSKICVHASACARLYKQVRIGRPVVERYKPEDPVEVRGRIERTLLTDFQQTVDTLFAGNKSEALRQALTMALETWKKEQEQE